jgi:hypothetical protein
MKRPFFIALVTLSEGSRYRQTKKMGLVNGMVAPEEKSRT